MSKFTVVGTIVVSEKPESYVSCVGNTPQEAAEGWYYLSCGYNNYDPVAMAQNLHHQMLIDACYFLKTKPIEESISILDGDETLKIMKIPEFPQDALHGVNEIVDTNWNTHAGNHEIFLQRFLKSLNQIWLRLIADIVKQKL